MAVNIGVKYEGEYSAPINYVCFGGFSAIGKYKIVGEDGHDTYSNVAIMNLIKAMFPKMPEKKVRSFDVTKIEEIQFYPCKKSISRHEADNACKFILALEKLGINKVVKYLKWDDDPLERVKNGLTADARKFSGPMICGAFELYRLLQGQRGFIDSVAYLLGRRIAPKWAVFMPLYFYGGTIGNSAVNYTSVNPGYGSFEFFTKKHISSDTFRRANETLTYRGIHTCYTLPVKRRFKTNIKELPGALLSPMPSSQGKSSKEYETEYRKALRARQAWTVEDTLKICRKIQNGSF